MKAAAASALAALAPLLCGCSLVLDPDQYVSRGSAVDAGPRPDTGGGMDAGPPDARPTGPVPPESFCDELTELVCQAMIRCCPMPGTLPMCLVDFEARCQREFAPAALDPRAAYSPEVAREVLDEGWGFAAACDETNAMRWLVYRVIDVFQGTVPRDAECETALPPDPVRLVSCVGDNVCRYIGSFWIRRCLPRVPETQRCYESFDCEPGLYCAGEPGRCVPAQAPPAPCNNELECESLQCSGPPGAAGMLTCQPPSDSAFCFGRSEG